VVSNIAQTMHTEGVPEANRYRGLLATESHDTFFVKMKVAQIIVEDDRRLACRSGGETDLLPIRAQARMS
jgi:hypothetical protein